jgi:uncharacterized metal-binding protein YceD (DUF177 family)
MTVQEEFSRIFQVRKIPTDGLTATLVATPEECVALARRMGVLACENVRAELTLAKSDQDRRVDATGRLTANVVQACVVTLEPVSESIDEPLELLFLEESLIENVPDAEITVEDLLDDAPIPDPIVRGYFDIGAVIAEHLALALDPYPRRADAIFNAPETPDDEPKRANPFAALRVLQGGGSVDTDGNET